MTSILTNTGAMVALQTLKGVNKDLGQVQEQISTGKKVGTAKDNAAVWAISKTMEADVVGFNKISEGLAVGTSTVAVARDAAETVTSLLTQMKDKIVQSQDSSQDPVKIQADIEALREQVSSVLGSAQFNGVNLVNDGADIEVLSSLDRNSGGVGVTSSKITVAAQDLSIGTYTAADVFSGSTVGASTDGDTAAFSIDDAGTQDLVVDGGALALGDSINIRVGDKAVSYTVTQSDLDTDPSAAVANGLRAQLEGLDMGLEVDSTTVPGTLDITNNSGAALTVNAQYKNAGAGGLGELSSINVTTATGPADALVAIETALQTAVDAAAAFGTAQNRLEIQNEFVSKLTDNLKAGIGSMVDADMEEASARLQALQTQQQLGIQSLSIANQAPQSVLSLFR